MAAGTGGLAAFCLVSLLGDDRHYGRFAAAVDRQRAPRLSAGASAAGHDCDGESNERWPPFFKNRGMWIGFALAATWSTLHGLHAYFPEGVQFASGVDLFHQELSTHARHL